MKFKKVFTWATVSILTVALATGCGGGSTTTEGGSGGDSGGKIRIGSNLELTGKDASYGQSAEKGIKLAFKEKNAKGGVLGKQLEYVPGDNKSDSAEATAVVTRLATQEKVVAIIGATTSGNTIAPGQIAAEYKVPLVSPTATNERVTVENGQLKPYSFRVCFIDPFQGEVAANFALNDLKVKTAAIFTDQKSDYAIGLADVFKKNFEAAGGTIVASEQYVGGSDKDFRSTLTNVKAKNPELIFVPGYYQEVGILVKQARELEMTMPILGGDGWDSPELVNIAGAASLNNTFYSNHVATDDPALADFVKAYKAENNGEEPDAFAALSYEAANVIIYALEQAGSADGAKLRDALENLKGFKGVGGTVNMDPATHNPVKSAVILELLDGKKVFRATVAPK